MKKGSLDIAAYLASAALMFFGFSTLMIRMDSKVSVLPAEKEIPLTYHVATITLSNDSPITSFDCGSAIMKGGAGRSVIRNGVEKYPYGRSCDFKLGDFKDRNIRFINKNGDWDISTNDESLLKMAPKEIDKVLRNEIESAIKDSEWWTNRRSVRNEPEKENREHQ